MTSRSFLEAYKFSKLPVTIYHVLPTVSTGKPAPLLVFIPGNPGIVDFYIPYLNRLHKRFKNYEILCISHLGHDASSLSEENLGVSFSRRYWNCFKHEPIYTLEEQTQSKIEIIKNFLTHKNGDLNSAKMSYKSQREILILGHSMGAYVAQRVVKGLSDLTEANVTFVGLVFPTIIDISKSASGKVLTRLDQLFASLPIVVGFFAVLLNVLFPKVLLNLLVRAFVKCDDTNSKPQRQEEVTKCVLKLLENPLVIRQVIGLAAEEMHSIKNDVMFNDQFFDTSNEYKIWGYFAQQDHWVNNTTREYIKTRYFNKHSQQVHKLQECDAVDDLLKLKHGFVISHSDLFADITIKAIEELVGE